MGPRVKHDENTIDRYGGELTNELATRVIDAEQHGLRGTSMVTIGIFTLGFQLERGTVRWRHPASELSGRHVGLRDSRDMADMLSG